MDSEKGYKNKQIIEMIVIYMAGVTGTVWK